MKEWLDARKQSYRKWQTIEQVDHLLNEWRFTDNDSYRRQAIKILEEAGNND